MEADTYRSRGVRSVEVGMGTDPEMEVAPKYNNFDLDC